MSNADEISDSSLVNWRFTEQPITLLRPKSPGEPPTETIVPRGSPIWFRDGKPFLKLPDGAEGKISCRAAAKALGLERPTTEQITDWVTDSVCESMLGYTVEPDGIDEEGSPSWLLALGLI